MVKFNIKNSKLSNSDEFVYLLGHILPITEWGNYKFLYI